MECILKRNKKMECVQRRKQKDGKCTEEGKTRKVY